MARGVQSESYRCPDWYALIQAAKYLGCTAWELVEQPLIWQVWAHKAMQAEAEAQKILDGLHK